ncbi:MAG: hypothetical protein ACRD2P_07895 [Terriglobia bacterium]
MRPDRTSLQDHAFLTCSYPQSGLFSWIKRGVYVSALILAIAVMCAARGQTVTPSTVDAASLVTIRGTLNALPGKGPALMAPQKEYTLSGQSPYILHVLEDKRLLNQELQLEGAPGPNGTFIVSRLYAVRNGKLYKIQYYCDICNITYVQPGHCYCCGRETVLQEVPVKPANP